MSHACKLLAIISASTSVTRLFMAVVLLKFDRSANFLIVVS